MCLGPLPAGQVTRKLIGLEGTTTFEHQIGLDELREGSDWQRLTGRSLAPVGPEIDRRSHRSVRCYYRRTDSPRILTNAPVAASKIRISTITPGR